MQEIGRRVLVAYFVASVVLVLGLAAVVALHGPAGFYAIQGPRDAQAVEVKFLVFCVAWLYGGALVLLSQFPAFTRRHAVFLGALAVLAFLYLNGIREPHRLVLGDFRTYYLAAADMAAHRPWGMPPESTYLYPPLFALLIRPFTHLEIGVAAAAFRWVNHGALLLFAVLLYVALLRLGARRDIAGALVLVALVANVPVARTLIYLQVNILVADAMLAALVLYPRHRLLSALALTLAVHLKVYPVLLVIPFLLVRDWRWLAWFALAQLGVLAATIAASSWTYYAQFLQRIGGLEELGFRNVSVQSLVFNTVRMLGLGGGAWEQPLSRVLSLAFAGAIAWAGWPLVRDGVFAPLRAPNDPAGDAAAARLRPDPTAVVYSAFVVLPAVMLAISPSVWEHHFVLLQLSLLALVLVVRTPREWWLFLASYVAIFLLPTTEIYPVAYLRLLALALVGVLFAALAARRRAGGRVAPGTGHWPRIAVEA